jgi:hypothetical protein
VIRRALLLPIIAGTLFAVSAQSHPQDAAPAKQQQGGMGGASTGAPFAAIKDEKNRPITAGGFVDGAPVVFEDVTEKS